MKNHPAPQTLAVLAFALLFLGLAAPASAQDDSPTATIEAKATIVEGLTLSGNNDLNFGQIVAAGSGTQTEQVAKSSGNVGKFTATGTGSNQIEVTFDNEPSELTDGNGNSMPLSLTFYGNGADDAGTASEITERPATKSLVSGNYYIYVGGQLTVGDASANPAGTYDANVTLSIAYTGN